jgi:hypothetical protein
MSVQNVAARPATTWRPIVIGDHGVEARMREGRLASREYASAVLFMLVRRSQLPANLVDRSFSWLRVVDQEFCRGEGPIRKLGTDIGLKRDPVGEALRSLKCVIDECASTFKEAEADRWRLRALPMEWASTLLGVKERLDGADCSSLSGRLRQEIDHLIHGFGNHLLGRDWQACCETMTALDGLVSRELMADVRPKTVSVTKALCSMAQVIDECTSEFETANKVRPQPTSMTWPSIHWRVKEIFDNANRQACSRFSLELQQQIGDLIRDLESDMCGADWQACHETVAVLGRLVSRALLASPNAHPIDQREFPKIRSCGDTERALVSLRDHMGENARLVELTMSNGTMSGVNERLRTAADLFERKAMEASPDLDAAMNELISKWIVGLRSAANDDDARSYCENFIALRQALSLWIYEERSGRREPVEHR